MPSRQQESAKNGSERYLMFGPNYILETLKWDDGRSPGHKNVFCFLLNRYKFLPSTAYALRNRQGEQAIFKENEKKYLC